MNTEDMDDKKTTLPETNYSPSLSQGTINRNWKDMIEELKHTFLTKDGWIGDYVRNTSLKQKCQLLTLY